MSVKCCGCRELLKEFLELQDQLNQMKREKFNGVELFAVEEEWDDMQGVNKDQLFINGVSFNSGSTAIGNATDNTYEYFDDPVEANRTRTSYDKYEFQLFTHPSGDASDGSIKLNIINLQLLLGIKDPTSIASGLNAASGTPPTLSISKTLNLAGLNQPALTVTDDKAKLTNNDGSGYIKDITEVSVEEFTNIIEKIADARAENGAEQQRVNQSIRLQQNNLVNLEVAHGRIKDVDVALESTRLAATGDCTGRCRYGCSGKPDDGDRPYPSSVKLITFFNMKPIDEPRDSLSTAVLHRMLVLAHRRFYRPQSHPLSLALFQE